MALRCLLRLCNRQNSLIRSSAVLLHVHERNFSVIAKQNDFLCKSKSLNVINVRSKYDKKASKSTAKKDEVNIKHSLFFTFPELFVEF
jgi:hypothetical protein